MTASWPLPSESSLSAIGAEEIRLFVQDLMAAEPAEMDCQGLLEIIARYVDLEQLGGQPAAWMPSVPVHLGACDHCAELYDILFALADQVESPPEDMPASSLDPREGTGA